MEECLAELRSASERLDREGFWWRPTWQDLREGQRPPETVEGGDPGEWRHGWQYWSSSVSNAHYRETTMLAVPPLVLPTSVHILEGMRALHWRTAQQHQSSPFHHICCSNDSSCHSRSRKESAQVARLPRWVVTGLLAHEVVG